jgi:hypothetical protein
LALSYPIDIVSGDHIFRTQSNMSSPIVTPGSVTSAAEAIVALGEKPTVDRIRAYLQGGSPNKILPLLREWKAANQQPRTDTGAEQPHIAAPEPVREIVREHKNLWGGMAGAAEGR